MKKRVIAGLLFLLGLSPVLPAQNRGNLVIVGGALSPENAEVYQKFIELAGGPDKCFISIIPTASGCPMASGESFRKNLVKYGVDPKNVYIAPIAVVDCDETNDVDESQWIKNAHNQSIAETIGRSTGIWFTGGDQSRTIKALRNPDGTETPALWAVYEAYHRGAVVGGTSAGAAIMSPLMITGGVSMAALRYGITDRFIDDEQSDNGPLTMAEGLGFFPHGIVDQHFDKRHRLGRLIVAVSHSKPKFRYGFGIDENTALVYYAEKGEIEALGEGGVTIVDGLSAEHRFENYHSYSKVMISYIEKSDRYSIKSGQFYINPLKRETRGQEYYNLSDNIASGIFSPQTGNFKELVSYRLIDNKAVNVVYSYCIYDENLAFKVTFTKTEKSNGYWTNKISGVDHYSFVNVMVDITPVKITVTPVR